MNGPYTNPDSFRLVSLISFLFLFASDEGDKGGRETGGNGKGGGGIEVGCVPS